jgi:hypothetical protein
MSIHAYFADKEEKQNVRYKAAEALAVRKIELIMRCLTRRAGLFLLIYLL